MRPRGVEADVAHRRQVDDQAVVHEGGAGDVVPAAADGERQAVLGREADRLATSAASAQRAIAAGRLSIMPFQTRARGLVLGVVGA